jgi:predicted nuclease of predicted toxin-antitoxin system
MRTLSTELGALIDREPPEPRVYADANVPAGLVTFMRHRLRWDVFYVMEQDDLRRARDTEHFRLARQMHRTLVTLDRDYFDDERFPPRESSGVIVLSAPDEQQLTYVLRRVDRWLRESGSSQPAALPLAGRKVHAHPEPPPERQRRRRGGRR